MRKFLRYFYDVPFEEIFLEKIVQFSSTTKKIPSGKKIRIKLINRAKRAEARSDVIIE